MCNPTSVSKNAPVKYGNPPKICVPGAKTRRGHRKNEYFGGLSNNGQGPVDIQNPPGQGILRRQSGVSRQSGGGSLGPEFLLELRTLGVVRAVKAESSRRAEDQVIYRQAVGGGGDQGLDEAVAGLQLPDGLPAHPQNLVLQIGILIAGENLLHIGVMNVGVEAEFPDETLDRKSVV